MYTILAKRRWTYRVHDSITATNTECDNHRQTRHDVESYFIEKSAIVETMRSALTGADMPVPEINVDGQQLINLTMVTYTKLYGVLPYLEYLLSMAMIL